MNFLTVILFNFFSAVVCQGLGGQQLIVKGKDGTPHNILGYSSYNSYNSKIKELISDKLNSTYTFILQCSTTSTPVLLSRLTAEQLIFWQFLHSFQLKNTHLIDLLSFLMENSSFNKNPRALKELETFISSNFEVPEDMIYEMIKFITLENPFVPPTVLKVIFYFNSTFTAFEKSVILKDINVVKWILEHESWEGKLLNNAIIEKLWIDGDIELIELLMEYHQIKADNFPMSIINQRFTNNETILHVASRRGFDDIISILLTKFGVNTNLNDIAGRSPLYRAVEMNKPTVVEKLISRGADVVSEPLLALAVVKGHIETVKKLLNLNVQLNIKDENGDLPLFLAVKTNNVKILEAFTSDESVKKALSNATNSIGENLLHIAASKGFLDSVKFLIKSGIDVNAKNIYGETPLYQAAKVNNIELFTILIKSGADIKTRTYIGETVMHHAASTGNIPIVRHLLAENYGLSVNEINSKGETPLHTAALSGKCEMLKFLIQNKGNINIKNEGFSILHTAAAEGNERAVICILDYGGMNVDKPGLGGITALNLAISQNHTRIAEILLKKKANPNAKSKSNWSPLHRAVLNGHLEMIELLHKYNANVNVINDQLLTPFQLAIKTNTQAVALIKKLFKDLKTEYD
ncbi:putative ankyrin repeat protein RF_0381 [Halyomorpha halys]|uniref:putative ankyrin repeat protein RF_0381 n=1 Tax=Halyomorpha halys TaxID=286706 RepID=UPI0006D4DBCB|nr:uncharacterized protein LOC106687554 [Halyomorpha halys]